MSNVSKEPELNQETVEIYCDGACSGNPGKGGYGYLIRYLDADSEKQVTGSAGYIRTTNNRMELMGCLYGLRKYVSDIMLDLDGIKLIRVLSDSSYLCNAFSRRWVELWKRRDWVTMSDSPVKNRDLWEAIDSELTSLTRKGTRYHFVCVPGHRGYTFNEKCDRLAVSARQAEYDQLMDDDGYTGQNG